MKKSNLQISKSFLKYSLVGLSGTFIDVLIVYSLFSIFNFPLVFSTFIGFFIAATNNFLLNKFWTFVNTNSRIKRQYIKFLIVSLIGLTISIVLMHIFVYYFYINVVFSKLIVSGIILSWNFLANKFWTFSSQLKLIYHPSNFEYTEDLTILIPAFNERKRIENTIHKIIDWQRENSNLSTELIVVDDGSIDGTFNFIQNKFQSVNLYRISKNVGKGGAIAHGIKNAKGRLTLLYDADSSTPISECSKMLEFSKGSDLIIGSRYLHSSIIEEKQSTPRRIISRIGNIIIRLILIEDIQDTQCGFKLLHTDKARAIFQKQKITRWGFDIEMLFLARAFDFTINEVGVIWRNDSHSKFRAFRDSLRTFSELVRIKYYAWFGFYK